MQTCRHQIVHHVVVLCHRREHAFYPRCLVALLCHPDTVRHVAITTGLAGRDLDAITVAGFHIFDGCYNDRSVRGSTQLSMHARAAALDWNAEKWPLWSERRMPDNYAAIWRAESWRLGEDYTGRKDPMHVEACR